MMRRSAFWMLIALTVASTGALAQDLDGQIRQAEAAVEANPNDVDALCNLASLYRRAGRLDEALTTAQRAVAADDKSVQARHQLALTWQARMECGKCIEEWEKALALDPTFYKAAYNIGVVHHDWAERLINEAETLRAARRRREAAEKAKEAEPHIAKARESWETSLKLHPDHAPSNYNLGVLSHRDGDLDGAIALYRRTIELDPKHVKAHVNLGLCLARKEQNDEAIGLWEQAAKLDPGLFEPSYNLGVLYAQISRLNEAIVQWEKARDVVKPRFAAAEREKKEPDRTQLAVNLANCHYNIGVAHEMQNDLKRAEASYQEAVRVNPNMDEAWQMLRNLQRRDK